MMPKEFSQATVRAGLGEVYPRLWRYALVLTGNRDWADDLVQSTALRAMEKSDLFDPNTHLDRWLFRMAQRVWLNELRARKTRQGTGLVPVDELVDSKSGEVDTNILAGEVLGKIGRLPEAQRVTVLLVYVEGYLYSEAAEHLEIPIGTVMSRLAAARKTLGNWANGTAGAAG